MMQNWFERLTGLREESTEAVHRDLRVEGDRLFSSANGKSFICGRLETPSLAELRARVAELDESDATSYAEVIGDVQALHADPANAGALFQAASQFNLLEMPSPSVTPEAGVGRYENDHTQGPACAVAAGAGTLYRNYFAAVDGGIGQTATRQINCLADLAQALDEGTGIDMRNGYAFVSRETLFRISEHLSSASSEVRNRLRGLLRIGIQWDTEVTLPGCGHRLTQVYGAALPIGYSNLPARLWEPFARLVLEASYEACLCAGALNAARSGNPSVYLTLLGGGVFQNPHSWIFDALNRALSLHPRSGLQVRRVCFGR